MNTILEIKSNGSKWAGQEPDTIETLLNVLKNYPLDPTFEKYGNFVHEYIPQRWTDNNKHLEGCTSFFGNFYSLSHVFNIITNDKVIIERLTAAIRKNQETAEYKQIKADKEAKQ